MTLSHVQLSLDGTTDRSVYRRDEVMAIDGRHTENGQRVADLARLGYLPEPVLDPTFGWGAMWTEHQPERLVTLDNAASKHPQIVGDFRALPFRDRSFASVLYDPPYTFRGTATGEQDLDARYGTDEYRVKAAIKALVEDGAVECARVADQYLIVKCQASVVAEHVTWQPIEVALLLDRLGWRFKDSLLLQSYRAQPAGRSQRNARRNYSEFCVFTRRGRNRWNIPWENDGQAGHHAHHPPVPAVAS